MINDYKCTCGYVFEDIDDKVFKRRGCGKCPECGKEDVIKLFPRPNFKVVNGTPKFYGRG